MNLEEFKATLEIESAPEGVSQGLLALWTESKQGWEASHDIVNEMSGEMGSLIHAYLHRVEGDLPNARYWYNRAGRPECKTSLAQEWDAIALELLA